MYNGAWIRIEKGNPNPFREEEWTSKEQIQCKLVKFIFILSTYLDLLILYCRMESLIFISTSMPEVIFLEVHHTWESLDLQIIFRSSWYENDETWWPSYQIYGVNETREICFLYDDSRSFVTDQKHTGTLTSAERNSLITTVVSTDAVAHNFS